MRREASSGRRLDDPHVRSPRTITKIRGRRLWSTVLRVSRAPDGPVVELRQRPWTGVVLPAAYGIAGLAAGLAAGPLTLSDIAFLASGVALVSVGRAFRRRSRIRAGPEGLTLRSRVRPTVTYPWSDVHRMEVAAAWYTRYFWATVEIETTGASGSGTRRLRFGPLSLGSCRPLSLVLLATCHRYGVPGAYRRYGSHDFWTDERPIYDVDERYLRPRRPIPFDHRDASGVFDPGLG